MSAPGGGGGAPSPAPRSGSIGPNATMPLPPQQPIAAGNPPIVHTPTTPGPSGPPQAPVSQQNLNQIVSHFSGFLLYAALCQHMNIAIRAVDLLELREPFCLCLEICCLLQ